MQTRQIIQKVTSFLINRVQIHSWASCLWSCPKVRPRLKSDSLTRCLCIRRHAARQEKSRAKDSYQSILPWPVLLLRPSLQYLQVWKCLWIWNGSLKSQEQVEVELRAQSVTGGMFFKPKAIRRVDAQDCHIDAIDGQRQDILKFIRSTRIRSLACIRWPLSRLCCVQQSPEHVLDDPLAKSCPCDSIFVSTLLSRHSSLITSRAQSWVWWGITWVHPWAFPEVHKGKEVPTPYCTNKSPKFLTFHMQQLSDRPDGHCLSQFKEQACFSFWTLFVPWMETSRY